MNKMLTRLTRSIRELLTDPLGYRLLLDLTETLEQSNPTRGTSATTTLHETTPST